MTYLGFEPNPACVFYLERLVRANSFVGTTVIPVGILDETRLISLVSFSDSSVDSCASVIEGFRDAATAHGKRYVPVFKYAEVASLGDIEEVRIIKIDVEGAELEVLQGLREPLNSSRPFVLIEVLPVYSREFCERLARQEALERTIAELKYSLFRVLKTDGGRLAGLEKLKSIGIHSSLVMCDYLLVLQR